MTMSIALFLVALVGLVVACVLVAALIVWHPAAHDRPTPAASDPLNWCEYIVTDADGHRDVCGAPAPFELAGAITSHGEQGGHSAMVAAYCAEHAPAGAVLVR